MIKKVTESSEIQFPNGSDHAMIACYLELYKEGEDEHTNGPTHLSSYHGYQQAVMFGIRPNTLEHTYNSK